MRSFLRAATAASVAAAALSPVAAVPAAAQARAAAGTTGLTIYNDGRVLVRRTVPVAVPRGASTQRVALGALDPATLFSLDSAVTLTGARYDAAVDEGSVLRRAVGQRLLFRSPRESGPADTVSAVVVGVDPLRLRMPDGRIAFQVPGVPLYPAELVMEEQAATLQLVSAAARDALHLGYFSGGASWQASYQVVLGRGGARVTGSAVIPSETLRAEEAEVQLLAGAVSRVEPQAPPMYQRRQGAQAKAMVADAMTQQRVGEFHLYSLPGRLTIQPGLTTTAALFEPARVPYERNLVVPGELPIWGPVARRGDDETDVPVEVSYTLKRPRGSGRGGERADFGDRPLPGGVARLFEADAAGRLQLVGEAALDHTPAGEDLRLAAGTAFDLTAKRVQTAYTTRRDSLAPGNIRTIATIDYRVTVTNAADSAATVDVLEERQGEWSVVESSVRPEKLSSTRTRFRLQVPERGERAVTYRLRVVW